MHEHLTKRVAELKELYANGGYVTCVTESGRLKVLSRIDADNPDYSSQGGLQWIVTRYEKDNTEIGQYGPMDTRELKLLHSDLFWNGDVQYG